MVFYEPPDREYDRMPSAVEITQALRESERAKMEMSIQLAALREENERLKAKLARVIALHHDGPGYGDPNGWCAACGDCWPCSTVAAAKGE